MCQRLRLALLKPHNYFKCVTFCAVDKNISGVHVHNVQVYYICILVPCCCAAPINSSAHINSSFTSG
uniref:Uncharacterized protein n=1 Tax=Macaca fascicularis TaxID=9541 RepID=A0A7N9CCI2_MACFA